MAIVIDYITFEILVDKVETTFVQTNPLTGLEERSINIPAFAQQLGDLQDNEFDVWSSTAYEYTIPKDIDTGLTLAPVLLILAPYTVTFEDGVYAISFTGGNTNLASFTNPNNVGIRSNNSAGLTYSKQVEDQSFLDGRVWVDASAPNSGTVYPVGTYSLPVNNLADALLIRSQRSLGKRLHLNGDFITTGSDDLSSFDVLGASAKLASLDITTGTNTNNLVITSCSVTGDLNGNITAKESTAFDNITDFDGEMTLCGLKNTIDLGSATDTHDFIDCYSLQPGTTTPIIDGNNIANLAIQFRRYSGGIAFRNIPATGVISLYGNQMNVILEATFLGTIVIRGDFDITDNSDPSATVVKMPTKQEIVDQAELAALRSVS